MVVRFLPVSGDTVAESAQDRGDLAEVIELRARLAQPSSSSNTSSTSMAEVLPLRGNTSATAANQADEVGAAQGEAERDDMICDDEAERISTREASELAVRLLARRARSSGELRRELLAAGHPGPEVEATVLECEQSLYLDDLGLARVLTEGLRQRKRASRGQIRMKLRERLLPDWAIEQVVGELDDDEEHELLRQTAADRARKMTGLDRATAERRLLGFLARRGWSGERATRVVREALDNTEARGTVRFR